MAETPSLAALTHRIPAGEDDRTALLGTMAAQVDDLRVAHLLRKA